MSIKKDTALGTIKISDEAIAVLAGGAVNESYGVVGMASQKVLKDGFYELLKKENYAKGVIVSNSAEGVSVHVYIVVAYGVNVAEVIREIQKKVKYTLEKNLNIHVESVHVFVQGIKVMSA